MLFMNVKIVLLLTILPILIETTSIEQESTTPKLQVAQKFLTPIRDAIRRGWNKLKRFTSDLLRPRRTLSPRTIVSPILRTNIRYVALGDSIAAGYGSGEGKLPLHPQDYDSCCYRNRNSYPSLLALQLHVSHFDFRACGGANALHSQNSVAHQIKGTSKNTNLVTVTVGGNDMGYGKVLYACFASVVFQEHCLRAISLARWRVQVIVQRDIRNLNAHLQRYFNGPTTTVVFTGYALPFTINGETEQYCQHSKRVRIAMNQLISSLNSAIRRNVDNFIPISFEGRELCRNRKSYYINRIKPAVRPLRTCTFRRYIHEHIGGFYHVSADGQLQYSRTVLKWYISQTRTRK